VYFVFVVLFSDLYCVFVIVVVVVVVVVSVIFGVRDRKQEREKTLFYTVRSEQLLPQTGELLFIPLANLPV
jgi:heme/copper-type cytochrome/quinol oxidase subunit 2